MSGDKKPSVLGQILVPVAVILLAGGTSPAAQPHNSQSQQIWGCRAEGGGRTYVVDQLNQDANSFDMAIYKASGTDYINDGGYIGTVQVNVTQKEHELVGRAHLDGNSIEVNAFGRTVGFTVRDSVVGHASGRCDVQWEMADSQTRRLVRQCLALAARKFNNDIAQVTRFGCTGNPGSYIEQLQRRP